jgi:hypothetical protein
MLAIAAYPMSVCFRKNNQLEKGVDEVVTNIVEIMRYIGVLSMTGIVLQITENKWNSGMYSMLSKVVLKHELVGKIEEYHASRGNFSYRLTWVSLRRRCIQFTQMNTFGLRISTV